MEIPLSRLPARGLLPVTLDDGTEVVVVVCAAGISVLADECPHQGLPLSSGSFVDESTIECPFHGARFSALTGSCTRGPATEGVPRFASTIVGPSLLIGPRQAPG